MKIKLKIDQLKLKPKGTLQKVILLSLFLLPGGFFVILLGIFWLIFALHEANRRESWKQLTNIDDWDFDVTGFLRVLTGLGFIVGLIAILSGVAGLIFDAPPSVAYKGGTGEHRHLFTCVFLIILGFFTLLKPLNDIHLSIT